MNLPQALLLSSALLAAPVAAQTAYVFTNVGSYLDDDAFLQQSLTNDGLIASSQRIPFVQGQRLGSYGGFLWMEGQYLPLTRPSGAPIFANVGVDDVNDAGTVVGDFGREVFRRDGGYVWRNGETTELFAPAPFGNQTPCYPKAINAAGTIVGYTSGYGTGWGGAVVWSSDLVPTVYHELRSAYDLNEAGRFVGVGKNGGSAQAPWFHDGTAFVPIGTLPGGALDRTYPVALNDRDEALAYVAGGSRNRGFVWSAAAGRTELAGQGDIRPADLNDAGEIVGRANGALVVWPAADAAPVSLEALTPGIGKGPSNDWYLLTADAINDWGQVSGVAVRRGIARSVAYLLTPAALTLSAPAPGTGAAQLTLAGATPGAHVRLYAGLDDAYETGYRRLPGCGGMGLAMAKPVAIATTVAAPDGSASFAWSVPESLRGLPLRLQAAEPGGCAVSNLVEAAF